MSHNKLYRNFIILQEDEKEHIKDGDKPLSGYAKIEAKNDRCKISFYTQNLKKDDEYFMVLICYKKDMKKIVDLGSLKVDEFGKGEAYKDYYINDIAGLDFSYDKISGAGIYKNKDGKPSFLMYGFINGESDCNGWKSAKITKCDDAYKMSSEKEEKKFIKEAKKESKKEEKKQVKEIIKVQNKSEENIKEDCNDNVHEEINEKKKAAEECKIKKDEKEPKQKKDKSEDVKELEVEIDRDGEHRELICENYNSENKDKDKFKKRKYMDIEAPCIVRGETPISFEDYERKIEQCKTENFVIEGENSKHQEDVVQNIEYELEENKKVNIGCYRNSSDTFELQGALGQFFTEVIKDFEEITDEIQEINNCKWYRVKVDSLDDMCDISDYNRYNIAYYPMISYYPYIQKNGYYIVGYKCDEEGNVDYIGYGIPGSRQIEEQPYSGKTGFVTWIKNDLNRNDGCWLMFYDYKKSTVVIPIKE